MRSVLFLIGCLLCASVSPALAEKRVALVIGVSKYQQVPQLANPARDADAIAALFKQAGFDVITNQRDLGISELRKSVREFSETSRDADISVVYYAGHGIEVDGVNYLVPADAKLVSDFDIEDETMSLDRVLKALDTTKRLKLVILDACRDNPFAKTMKRSVASRSVGRGLAKIEPTTSDTLVAFAARAGAVAADGEGNNSPFASALVKHITEPGLDLRIAFGRVRDDVLKSTGNRQEPFLYGSLGGDTMSLVPSVATKVDTEAGVRVDYELAAQIGTKEAWDSFLASHPTGLYAGLARAQNNKLATAQPDRQKQRPTADGKEATDRLASLTPEQTTPKPPPSPQIDQTDIARLLQAHLKRVGCNAGNTDGTWDDSSRKALDLFNKNANTQFNVKVASLDALDMVRSKSDRVCPLICPKGEKEDGGRCVQISCSTGYVLTSGGACEKRAEPKARTVDRDPPPRARAAPASGGRGGKCFSFNGRNYCE